MADGAAGRTRRSREALAVAQHEAAHVVVGVALGLRLYEASLLHIPGDRDGHVIFYEGSRLAMAMMRLAGVVAELRTAPPHGRGDIARASVDKAQARQSLRGLGRGNYAAAFMAADAILASRVPIHTAVTRALLERDLRAADIAALARGERVYDF